MIARALRSVVVGSLIVLASAGCDSTKPEPVYELSPYYRLQSKAGHEVPYQYACVQSNPSFMCTLSRGYISFLSTALLELSTTIDSGSPGGPDVFTTAYAYTRLGNRLRLTSLPGAQVTESFEMRVAEGSVRHGDVLYVASPPE